MAGLGTTPEVDGLASRVPPAVKIGLVTHYMPPHHGGIERVAEALFASYLDAGMDVRWVASHAPRDAPAREGRRIRVPCWNWPERVMGVPVPLWGPTAWREVSALVRWADALHVHDCLYPGSVMAAALARRQRKIVLLSQHVGFIRYRSRLLNGVERLAYATLGRAVLRRASWLVFATPAARAHVADLLGHCPARACEIANGIDLERFAPATRDETAAARAELELSQDRPVVLFVGRLVEKKNIHLVVEVARRLTNFHFLIVGDGPLRTLLSTAGVNVSWRPAVAADRMRNCYHAADCLLVPSHGEGLPVVVQEAMACALPVVISEDELYARPLAEQGVCVAAARTVDSMTTAVNTLLAHESASTMGTRARAYAEGHWNVRTMAARYISLVRELASPGAR
jgi:glycosyltransferase involved in cell wall biosynthesis